MEVTLENIVFSTSIKYTLCIIALIIVIYLLNLEKKDVRIKKYTIKPIIKRKSIFDIIYMKIIKTINDFSDCLKINDRILNYSNKKYKKYMTIFKTIDDETDIITIKMFVTILSLFIILIVNLINMETLTMFQILLVVLSYYIFDLIIYIKYKLYIKKIQNEILDAIIIMNNAFKSGKSIIGAVESVKDQTHGTLAKEFMTMYKELTFGLDVDIVFKRFSDKINIEELKYLSASISVLNRTGGNIVKVFELIEQNLLNKKKLQLEINSLTTGSKLMFYVVTLVPLIVFILINVINPEYFELLYTTMIGYYLLALIGLIYIIYIITIRNIMKVRM